MTPLVLHFKALLFLFLEMAILQLLGDRIMVVKKELFGYILELEIHGVKKVVN